MITTRLVGVVLVNKGWVVQSINFKKYLPIGRPDIAIYYLDRWGIDELVLLDIEKTGEKGPRYHESIRKSVKQCNTPVAVGGGISSVEDAVRCIRYGADKVVINSAFVVNPKLVGEISKVLGRQAVVVSLDAKLVDGKEYRIAYNSGKVSTSQSVSEAAKLAEEFGAGEILVNSIDKDGTKSGYDLELVKKVSQSVEIPVVACGGVGQPSHFLEGIRLGISGVAAANYFHFTEHSVIKVKRCLMHTQNEYSVRLDTYANYERAEFNDAGNILPKKEEVLDGIRYEYIAEEKI